MTRPLRFVYLLAWTELLSHEIQSFITSFLTTGDDLALSIQGDSNSTPFNSLSSALEGVSLSASIKGMNANPILTHVNVYISVSRILACSVVVMSHSQTQLSTLVTNLVEVDFDVHNPLDADLQITLVQADSGVDDEVYALYVSSHLFLCSCAHDSKCAVSTRHLTHLSSLLVEQRTAAASTTFS